MTAKFLRVFKHAPTEEYLINPAAITKICVGHLKAVEDGGLTGVDWKAAANDEDVMRLFQVWLDGDVHFAVHPGDPAYDAIDRIYQDAIKA